jgi:hypothetical protein
VEVKNSCGSKFLFRYSKFHVFLFFFCLLPSDFLNPRAAQNYSIDNPVAACGDFKGEALG